MAGVGTAHGRAERISAAVERIGDVARNPTLEGAVDAVRELLGVEIAFATRFTEDEQVIETVQGGESFGLGPGAGLPRGVTYCDRILRGELPPLMGDLRANDEAAAMPITEATGIAAYASVPLRVSDGTVYGTLCAASRGVHREWSNRDEQFLHVLARVLADQVEREALQVDRQRAHVQSAAVGALLAAVEARDGYTAEHSAAVVDHAVAVARRMGLDEREVVDVEHVAALHDVGKIGVPDAILRKPTKLSEEEWTMMREHPVIGGRVVGCLPGLQHLALAVRAEHERWDGGGYPDGLSGEDIPAASRIVLVCDAWHAMTSDRPYRAALPREEAIGELRRNSGTQFCPEAVDALLAVLEAEGEQDV